jgi:glycerophosphoryl diester phosphodiesterase
LLDFAKASGVEALDGDWDAYSPEMVEVSKPAGVKIWPDIQTGTEDGAYFTKVLARGFTGVQTDHPEALIAWLKARKLR